MKRIYYKPEMSEVTVIQQQSLLGSGSSHVSDGPSADFMSSPTISSGASVKQESYYIGDDD